MVTGERVLAALSAGRQRAIDAKRLQAAILHRHVLVALNREIIAGRSHRGRAGRIKRQLSRTGVVVTERHVLRILDRLFSESGSICHDQTQASE